MRPHAIAKEKGYLKFKRKRAAAGFREEKALREERMKASRAGKLKKRTLARLETERSREGEISKAGEKAGWLGKIIRWFKGH